MREKKKKEKLGPEGNFAKFPMKPETSNFTREVLPRLARRTLFPSL